ncbi:ras-related protein Rap-2a-like [Haliotis rufescens]|uniref:ras-related protein Rap-2a-like n=1 Tax=Haliotis rufescens TaxID=6454 RepID=UPI00201EA62C|nr:ras-related protein Rap-2a-like [Haliotis rufescens]
MSATNTIQSLNIVVLGAPGVGKSCIISQFLHHKFLESSGFTIELEQQSTVLADKKRQISLDIVDTPGGYCFQERRRMAIAAGDAFILVFSLDKECSFETVAMLRDEIVRIKKTTKVPILLVGNKSDIDDEKRITSCKGAKLFAKKEWKTKYVEACAMDHNSVTEVFRKVLKLAKVKVQLSSHAYDLVQFPKGARWLTSSLGTCSAPI